MMRSLVRLSIALTLLISACAPAAQPAPTSAPSKPAEPAKPAEAAKPAAAPTAASAAKSAAGGSLIFFSTQFKPIEEAEKMRQVILKDAPVQAEFIPEDAGPFNDRLISEQRGGRVTVSLVGGLHGDFAPFVQADQMEDLTPLMAKLADRGFPQTFTDLSRMGTPDKSFYVPWMQATYVLAINKKALPYLPAGADVNALSYAQLKEWGGNIQRATNQRKLGFPGGPKGLIHRFFQGYLYPSYTGSSGVVGFKSSEAVAMWQEFKDLWAVSNPQSANYEFMQEPLLAEEVWVAWDHTARLIDAVKAKPDDFVLVPSPSGPKGRGFMPVIAGLSIPKGAPNRAGAEQLIEYLTQTPQQVSTLRELAFFPATGAKVPDDLPPGIRLEADAVARQSSATDALPSLLPIGLGAKGGEFNKVYLDSFTRIVIKNEAAQSVLEEEARTLQSLMDETKAGCWPPDPPTDGPCKVK
jgi:multiple sugar transport system substrate-binding protein